MAAALLGTPGPAQAAVTYPTDVPFHCQVQEGNRRHPYAWNMYIQCRNGVLVAEHTCPDGAAWNNNKGACGDGVRKVTDFGVRWLVEPNAAGDEGTLTYTLTATSGIDRSGVRVHGTLPAGVTWNEGHRCYHDSADRAVDCFLRPTAAGDGGPTATARFVTTVPLTTPATIEQTLGITSTLPRDSDPANNAVSARCEVADRALRCA
ncbi:hypothetical protein GCM10010123_22000 [Pilimelia anulata]|uniref:Uncharacterized protein n=1 Tax=Pilimelia anulata TaxID=53371 RepID=A0A8J3F805_9ACTN|nr:hypothetical protein GCM10010123_22000 [Pilimelia anulata]